MGTKIYLLYVDLKHLIANMNSAYFVYNLSSGLKCTCMYVMYVRMYLCMYLCMCVLNDYDLRNILWSFD
jgi:hypothetical protein